MTPDEYIKFLEENGFLMFECQKTLLKKWIAEEPIFIMPMRRYGYEQTRILFEIYLKVFKRDGYEEQ
ncbi:MAG: hypothetical protein PUE12_18040 [Oscillospiraceae bacterium]|nr:hypothetical protein [Oscillospiraceae bacterium]